MSTRPRDLFKGSTCDKNTLLILFPECYLARTSKTKNARESYFQCLIFYKKLPNVFCKHKKIKCYI